MAILWPALFDTGHAIHFAHTSFKWANLASHNAGVTVIIVGLTRQLPAQRRLFSVNKDDATQEKQVQNIKPYLVAAPDVLIKKKKVPSLGLAPMLRGNMPYDGGNLLLDHQELQALGLTKQQEQRFIKCIYGSSEFINGKLRYCLWIDDENLDEALAVPAINERVQKVKEMRLASRDKSANAMASKPHQMREMNIGHTHTIVAPCVSSEARHYLPVGLVDNNSVITNLAFALYDAPLWNMALIASRLHLVWIATVCVRLRTDFSYSNTLGWNTFPVPTLTDKNKADLTRSAEAILEAREVHFPATIADLYNPEQMPDDLRAAHDDNDRIIESIYIGRRFKNDTERLEKLFALYRQMTAAQTGK